MPDRLHRGVHRRRTDEAESETEQRLRAAPSTRAVVAGMSANERGALRRPLRLERPDAARRASRTSPRRDQRRAWRSRSSLRSCRGAARCPRPAAAARRRVLPKRATLAASKPLNARAEVLALAQDRQPRESGLEPFEAELLVQAGVVDDRPAPLVVVVRRVVGRARAPRAPAHSVGSLHHTGHEATTLAFGGGPARRSAP